MSFDPGGGQMGMSLGFSYDPAGADQFLNATNSIINSTNQLSMSQQTLASRYSQMQSTMMPMTQSMQQYSQTLQQVGVQQQQLQTTQQQSISILSGAGTQTRVITEQTTNYGGALAYLSQQLPEVNRGLGEHNTLQEDLAQNAQTSFDKVQQLVGGFGQAAGSLTGLAFSTYALQRAQFQLHRTETMLEVQQNRLSDQGRKLEAAMEKYGAASSQVQAIREDMGLTEQKITNLQERQGLVQENYTRQLMVFATTTGPLVISTISSMFQGLTAMGDVLKINRTQVLNFISAWGGMIGVGSAIGIAGVALGLFTLKVQEAQKQIDQLMIEIKNLPEGSTASLQKWIQASDTFLNSAQGQWAKILKTIVPVDLSQIPIIQKDPIAIMIEQLKGAVGSAENTKLFSQIRLDLINSINDNFVNAPEMKLIGLLPPQTQETIKANLSKMFEFIKNDSNWRDKANTDFTLGVMQPLAKDIQTQLTNLGNMINTPGVKLDVGKFIEQTLNSPATVGAANRIIELLRSDVMAGRPIKDLTGTIDLFAQSLAKSTQFAGADVERVKELATAHLTAISPLTNLTDRMKEKAKTTQDAIKEDEKWTEAIEQNAIVQKQRGQEIIAHVRLVAQQVENTRALAGAYLGLNMSQSNNFALMDRAAPLEEARRKALMQENTTLIEVAKNNGLNADFIERNITVLTDEKGALVDNTAAMMQKNQAIKDAVVAEGNYFQILDGSIESIYKQKDAIYQANQAVTSFIEQTVLSQIKQQAQKEMLNGITDMYGIKLPQGIQLTIDQQEKLIAEWLRTGDTIQTVAEIHDKAMADMHKGFTELVDLAMKGGKDWSKAWKELDKEFIPKGKKSWVKDYLEDYAHLQKDSETMTKTISMMEQLRDAGFMKGDMADSWMRKLRKEIGEMGDDAKKLFPKGQGRSTVGAFFDEVKGFVGENINSANFNTISTFLQKVNDSITSGNFASDFKALNEQFRDLMELVSFQNTPGPPATGNDAERETELMKQFGTGTFLTQLPDTLNSISTAMTGKGGAIDATSQTVEALTGSKGLTVAAQTAQTAMFNFATQGANSMASFVSWIKPHVITIQTYFATTIAGAINAASKELVAFASLANKLGGGGGGGLKNVDLFGGGMISKFFPIPPEQFNDFDVNTLLNLLFPNRQYKQPKYLEMAYNTGGGGGSNQQTSRFANTPAADKIMNNLTSSSTNIAPQLDTMNRQINQVIANLGALAKASSTAMNGLRNNLNVGYVAAGHLQVGIANLANQGAASLQVLAKNSSTNVNGLRNNLNVGYVAAGHLQVGLANLANEGADSLKVLAKASSTNINGLKNNLNVGYVSAGHLQEGLANLANEGSDSMAALNKSASSSLSKLARVIVQVTQDVEDLADAINSLKSKTVTITAKKAGDGWSLISNALGGIYSFASGGILSAQPGHVSMTNGPQLVLIGDNPGGKEIHAMIPMNNPLPTLRNLQKVLGSKGIGSSGETAIGGGGGGGDDGTGTTVINLHIDGEKMMTWIRRRLIKNRQGQ